MNWFNRIFQDYLSKQQKTYSWDDIYLMLKKKLKRDPTSQEVQQVMDDFLFALKRRKDKKPYSIAHREEKNELV